MLLLAAGCTRGHYRVRADRETYCILDEKTAATPWQPPPGFNIQPDPRSRFCDPTCINDPLLPIPSPRLYAYRLPELPPRDPARFRTYWEAPEFVEGAIAGVRRLPPVEPSSPIHPAPAHLARALPPPAHLAHMDPFVRQAAYQQPTAPDNAPPPAAEIKLIAPGTDQAADPGSNGPAPANDGGSETEFQVVPVPQSVWQSIPPNCLMRMFEFGSIREEYQRSFGHAPGPEHFDPSQRLALEDIVELALINSREYQTQKETLYRVALRLTLERYEYHLKFSTSGNGTAVDYLHRRDAGITENVLAVPTTITGDKLLSTGGDLLARFANDVVLTFNGPDGFAADIGSALLLDISQNVFQRDVVFERLTQAERNVVYAARDFARFRKQLFQQLASEYYDLLLTYRGIEIDSQDYFSNSRAFNQGEAEYRAGQRSRVEVDQFEQNALNSRRQLIGSCNALESGLDRLKVRIGLPPELPVNLDLTELEELTLRDETAVLSERVQRARRNLLSERRRPAPDRSVLLNGAIELIRRMLIRAQLGRSLGRQTLDEPPLELLLARLEADEARLMVRFNRDVLSREQRAVPPAPPVRIFQRTMELVDSLREFTSRQWDLAARIATDPAAVDDGRQRVRRLQARFDQIQLGLQTVIRERRLDRIDQLIVQAEALLAEVQTLAGAADALVQYAPATPQQEQQVTLQQADRLLETSERMLADETGGLVPVEIGMDDAMLTALVQRFDLMNRRGELADFWRQIKLAGDDLKSVLNLNASQLIRTRSGFNRPFDFTFDDSQTRLALTLDTPFNRRAQRNLFRQSLIDYQAALRSLMELEDEIKLSIRDDLRQLQLDREQYQIAVASAALAYERVVSTRLQLRLGIEDVAARDFLEAQQAYTASLSAVARQHIGYIVNRIDLFVDLESLQVDERGFWNELYREHHQPAVQYQLPGYARPAYGRLPCNVCYSAKVRRMHCVPTGHTEVYREQPHVPPDEEVPLEAVPTPAPQPH